jgi:putative ABC transport system ATP-binding protein
MLIQTGDLAKTYNMGPTDVHALRGVTLAVRQGDFVAIMGASGSGKSTLLHLLGCLDRPSDGWYLLDGMEIESLDDADLSRLRNRKIGFVFQTFNLIAQHNILENVELPMVYAGWDRRARRERSLALLDQVGLGDKPHHRPTELSGGQIQRVAIARALAVDPLLLLADEPTGNLDSETGEAIMRLFVELNQRGATIIVVTHSREVASHARRMIEMRDGLVVRDLRGISPLATQPV